MDTVLIPRSDADLLNECDVETFRSSGKGGQNVNKVETAVRLRHRPTGIVVVSRVARTQYRNKLLCLEKLRERIRKLNTRKPRRIPTGTPGHIKRNNREEKIRLHEKKRLRRTRPDIELE